MKASLCRRHRTGGDGRGLGLGSGGRTLFLLKGVLPAAQGGDHAVAELLVHADVDHRVVDGGALGKEGRDGHEDGSKFRALMCEDPPGHTSIGQPTYQEGNDHENDHAGDLPLSPLGGLGLLLGSSGLLDGAEQTSVAEEDDCQWSEEVADEHVDNEGLIIESLCAGVVVNSAGALHALRDVTGPADERRNGTGTGHDPGEGQTHDCVILPKAEVADGLADDHPPFNSQNNQRPEANLTSQGGEEAFQVATKASKHKVAVHRGVHRCGESSEHHEEVGDCQVEQDVV